MGLGVPILLEAQVAIESIITGEIVWELTSQPVDSTADLEESPLDNSPWEIPVYDLADQTVYQVAGRKFLLPLEKGIYAVTATVPTDAGDIVLTQNFTAATYMGVGIIGDVEGPKTGQCALCHQDKATGGENIGTGWIETKHASKLTRNIDGIGVGFYAESCNECHTLGWNEAETADNHGFDDVRDLVGWTVPATLQEGNWEAIPQDLKEVSNIQCESCHGPGSEHFNGISAGGGSLFNPPSISMSVGVCGQCHDDLTHHQRVVEWNRSAHTTPPVPRPARGGAKPARSAIAGWVSLNVWIKASTSLPNPITGIRSRKRTTNPSPALFAMILMIKPTPTNCGEWTT